MGTLTHKAARAAYGTAIDAVLKHVKKDREKVLGTGRSDRKIYGRQFPKRKL